MRSGASNEDHLVADLIDQDIRQWDRRKLTYLFDQATMNNNLNIHLTQQFQHDQAFWSLSANGEYSIKLAYAALRITNSANHPNLHNKDEKNLWKLKLNARLKNLLWKMVWNTLPTCLVLINRFVLSFVNCYLCNNAIESIEHLFIQCDWATQIWLMSPWPIYLDRLNNLSISDWVKMILYPKDLLGLNSEESINFQLFAAIVRDHLWMIRNRVRVEGVKSNPMKITRQILRAFEEHKQAGRELINKPSRDPKCYPPPIDWVKLNFDVAIREGYSFVVVVSRDQEGNLIDAWIEKLV